MGNNPLESDTAFWIPRVHQWAKRNRYHLLPSVEPFSDYGAMRFGRCVALPSRNEATVGTTAEGQPIPFDSIENEFIKEAVEIVNSLIGFQSDGYLKPELLKLAKVHFLSQATAPPTHG